MGKGSMGLEQKGGQEVQEKIGLIFQIGFSGGRGLRTGLKMVCLERELNSAHQENFFDRIWVKIEKKDQKLTKICQKVRKVKM